jgi:uncharacterized Zn-finger protein
MSKDFWEEMALDLLEINLNGNSLNMGSIRELFKEQPSILDDLNIQLDGDNVDNLDEALYGGRPQIIEIREAKPSEIYHCKPCNRRFKRGDNFRRHLATKLHNRRQRAYEIAAQENLAEPKNEIAAEESKTNSTTKLNHGTGSNETR